MKLRGKEFKIPDLGNSDIREWQDKKELLKTADRDTILRFCKANKSYKEPGVSYDELLALYAGFNDKGQKAWTIVETGMCYGVTTRFFMTRVMRNGGKLITIELKPKEQFIDDMIKMGLWEYNTFTPGDTMKINWDPNEKIDFLFIDSEHALSDALGEYMRYRVHLRDKAYVGFHDSDLCYGVKRAIEIVQEMDKLELVAESSGCLGAGLKVFKLHGLGINQFKILTEMRRKEKEKNEASRARGDV